MVGRPHERPVSRVKGGSPDHFERPSHVKQTLVVPIVLQQSGVEGDEESVRNWHNELPTTPTCSSLNDSLFPSQFGELPTRSRCHSNHVLVYNHVLDLILRADMVKTFSRP
jgi:hypothetical protein